MSTIDASSVMELRRLTGAGMMDCKKFLVAAKGDMELAITEMRKAGQGKADKKRDRVAAEGVIVIASSPSLKDAVMVEVNSETDFVARDDNFTTFTNHVAKTALQSSFADVDALSNATIADAGMTIETARQELVAKIGENIQIRRFARVSSDDVVGCYLHGNRIGVVVALKGGDEALAKNIAMHIAAAKPLFVSSDEISIDLINSEREIFQAQALESGKPQDIIDRMIEGRISKFRDEISLLGQPYVKDPNKKISQLLKEHHAEVISFDRFEVGEGIEKKEDNFVEEVMAQVREK
jgi:elongation factor Ts